MVEMSNNKSNLKLNKNLISNFQSLAYVSRKSHGFGSKKRSKIWVQVLPSKRKRIFSFLLRAEGLFLILITHSLRVGK
jgi:hypothetical protein